MKNWGNLKKRIFESLDEYSSDEEVYVTDTYRDIVNDRMVSVANFCLVRMYNSLPMGEKPDGDIDADTPDSYEFEMSDLAFEALIALCASEMCRAEEAELYTRLIYKYKDLAEGVYNESALRLRDRKNTFFSNGRRRFS